MSRTSYSLRNIKYEVIGQGVALLFSFLTRMIFVRTLSAEYLGTNGLFTNILSILSFAELGVGTAIIYCLYKPLAENDVETVKTLMHLFKKAYLFIGVTVAGLGVALLPFLSVFINEMPDIPNINIIYLMYVFNSAISYFFSYKRSLIIADQKGYISSAYRYGFYSILNIAQMIILVIAHDYLAYLMVQISCTLLENISISRKADRIYGYLKDKKTARLSSDMKVRIARNIRAMMLHKIGGIVISGTGNLILSKFVSLVSVGIYSNYFLIINAVTTVFGLIFQALTASVGNLGAEGSKEKIYLIFKCMNFIGSWIYGLFTICLFVLINPFIDLWLGEKYLFQPPIVAILIANFYLFGMRKSVLVFKDALALFWYDRYKPVFESAVNIVFSIILVRKFGAAGVFLGTMISTLTVNFWVEPYVLYKHGLNQPLIRYYVSYMKYTVVTLLTGAVTYFLCSLISGDTILQFFAKIMICTTFPNISFLLLYKRTDEFKHLLLIANSIVGKK